MTGISTGALIAPFAFMGPNYDNVLTRVFTESDAGDIMQMRPFQAVFSHALYDTAPLAALITKHTPPSFRRAIAQKAQSGKEPAHCHLGT